MDIKTKFKNGHKLPIKVDGGKADGVIEETRVFIGKDNLPVITYSGRAYWTYKGQKYSKMFLASEEELEVLDAR